MFTLGNIARKLNLKFSGDEDLEIKCACGLENLKENGVAFFSNSKGFSVSIPAAKRNLKPNKNAEKIVIVTDENFVSDIPYNFIYSKDPLVTHTEIVKLLYPFKFSEIKIDKRATIAHNVKLGKNLKIDANVTLYDNVEVGDNSVIFAGVVIMANTTIGKNSIIYPNVVIRNDCHIGNNVTIHPNAVIGADGHGYFKRNGLNFKIPQIGKVYIEDDVEIGACTCIDRGRLEDTIIRKGTKIDNLVQIAHNVEIGENALISGQSGIAGSTKIGKNLILGAQSGIKDNITVGDNVIVAGKSGVISEASSGDVLAGVPAVPINKWRKQVVLFSKIETLFKKIKEIEEKLKNLF